VHKKHSKDAWYVAHDDAKGRAAAFGSWRDGSSHSWSNGTGRKLTDDELADIEEKKKWALAQEIKTRNQAALRAQRLYDQAGLPPAESSYLQRKQIECPEGVKYVTGLESKAFGFGGKPWSITGLIVPMLNKKGDIRSLQIIPDSVKSNKLFMREGDTKKCFFPLGDYTAASRILIGEGLATAQSARQATGDAAIVAFSASNLPACAQIARANNALAEIIILGDDDEAGLKYAPDAARHVARARVVFPGGGYNDFNDLHVAQGLDAVRAVIDSSEATQQDEQEIPWRSELIVKHKDDGSQVIPCRVHNLIKILDNADEFKGRIQFNEFSAQIAVDLADIDDIKPIIIKAGLEKDWIQEKIPTSDIIDAMGVVASKSPYHPVREYLAGLKWDGIERIPHFFEDYCGCERSEYHMAVAISLFVSAIARVMKPGCKVDTMVILESEQGRGKTKLWLVLFGEWCFEVTASLNDKDFYSNMRGAWCMDFAELDAFSKAETTQIKRILSSQTDNYRPHYARTSKAFPRQCIFVGGTNKDDWNTDSTGGRRYFPVRISEEIDVDGVAANRDQLWAEALVRFERGETWWDVPDAKAHQEQSYVGDPWDEPIYDHLKWMITSNGLNAKTTIAVVLSDVLKIDSGRQSRADQMRASAIIKRLGWERKKDGGKWVYKPKRDEFREL
jgi:putative DNA primase/helicase